MKELLKVSAYCAISVLVFAFSAQASGDTPVLGFGNPVTGQKAIAGDNARAIVPGSAIAVETGYPAAGYTEFDEFNNVNDPLYREGAKALLKKAIADDNAAGSAPRTVPGNRIMRDAPLDTPSVSVQPEIPPSASVDAAAQAPSAVTPAVKTITPSAIDEKGNLRALPIKKKRVRKLIPADPVKTNPTL